ncbi:hypothetical protein [Gordonia neofelifaecis]|uniref:AttH domain-containing protein n=1 Tax=Gordonia neofelifaecis NRRL B-59395 TaxID=644548 RepID=F1YF46_9ACTN|nr:hypothetical protein [Gordonia neofelifaecis]EGD56414.1 hypothetical protein SCNU_02637 [Gordonia neofelifaecis NRRL B-59395]
MLSEMDDYPIHQVAEVIRHVGTSDRNFYDRYYFNCHHGDPDDPWLIIGLGVYPNLGVTDCFAVVRYHDEHIVVRGSRALGANRNELQVGPFTVEILDGLKRLHVKLEPGHGDLSFDLVFDADGPAALEPRHFQRQLERVTFDTMRFVQTGRWTGSMTVDGQDFDVEPETWRGNRDRSWGVRPVGEAEPPGRRAANTDATSFFWIYSVMRFEDYAVSVIVQELRTGERIMGDARRIWNDPEREPEWLGRVEHDVQFVSGGREPASATLRFIKPSGEEIVVRCAPQLANFIGFGTGYGLEQDWRHGMWQGEEKVEALHQKISELDATMKLFCPADYLATFELSENGETVQGRGLFEFSVIGPHDQYGFTEYTDVAP